MNGSLYLFPKNPLDACDADKLVVVLQSLAIIAEPLKPKVWRAGSGFSQQVVFAGCSPFLRFEPETPDDTQFCHVALLGPEREPRLITGQNTVKPRCPHCRQRLSDWSSRLNTPASACPGCGAVLDPIDLDWRQHAAMGRVLIELRNVFPGEASPSDKFISELVKVSAFEWRYGWAAQHD